MIRYYLKFLSLQFYYNKFYKHFAKWYFNNFFSFNLTNSIKIFFTLIVGKYMGMVSKKCLK